MQHGPQVPIADFALLLCLVRFSQHARTDARKRRSLASLRAGCRAQVPGAARYVASPSHVTCREALPLALVETKTKTKGRERGLGRIGERALGERPLARGRSGRLRGPSPRTRPLLYFSSAGRSPAGRWLLAQAGGVMVMAGNVCFIFNTQSRIRKQNFEAHHRSV